MHYSARIDQEVRCINDAFFHNQLSMTLVIFKLIIGRSCNDSTMESIQSLIIKAASQGTGCEDIHVHVIYLPWIDRYCPGFSGYCLKPFFKYVSDVHLSSFLDNMI